MSRRHRAWAGRWLAALALASLGCGGGGGGGGGPTAPPPPPPAPITGVFFTASGSAAAAGVVLDAISPQGLTGPFQLTLEATDVSGLYGVSFDLRFPDERLRWRESATTEGTFLSEGGSVSTEVLIERRPAGNLIVGITRVGDVGGVDGSGTLLTLEFDVRDGQGNGNLRFRAADAVDAEGMLLTDVEFVDGSIEVRR